ncbi:MAG: queuosine precursor transporter [Anaerolineales bacterium]|nr:queuosine precursor transporter [Anaerolineales bacterium]
MRYKYFDRIMALFVSVLLISNIASSAKIVDWGVSLLGLPLAFDAGTILFPVSYIFGDVLTEVYGYRYGRRVIWTGFACSILMSVTLWLVAHLPGEAYWQSNVGQAAYDAVLGGISSGAIVLASLAAYWAGEFSNSFVLAKMKILTRGRWLWTRTIGSTLVGEGVDTFLFVTLATLFAVPGFSPQIWLTLVATNYIFKCGVEALMTPVTYGVVRHLKKVENEDYFDHDTNFNPFRISGL